MKTLYVVGGKQRSLRLLTADPVQWYDFDQGLIFEVDSGTYKVRRCFDYVSSPDAGPEQNPSILFKSGTIERDRLYICTPIEVMVYRLPTFERLVYLSLPIFNDVHHVRSTPDGNLLVANSGLDMVLEFTLDGQVLCEWSTLGEDPWSHFERGRDYRKVSTKPHRSHPNYVFYVAENIWATRFQQKDAVCLTRPDLRIELGLERPHDGLIYFTTVDGHLVIVDADALHVREVLALSALDGRHALLGWCRGILLDGDRIWVGFSRIRPTRLRENLGWVVRGFKHVLPTHIACYDLRTWRCVAEIDLEAHGLNAVFSILDGSVADQARAWHPHRLTEQAGEAAVTSR